MTITHSPVAQTTGAQRLDMIAPPRCRGTIMPVFVVCSRLMLAGISEGIEVTRESPASRRAFLLPYPLPWAGFRAFLQGKHEPRRHVRDRPRLRARGDLLRLEAGELAPLRLSAALRHAARAAWRPRCASLATRPGARPICG